MGDASTTRLIAQLHALTTAMKEFSGARSTRENQRILEVLTLAVAHEQIGVADMMRCTGLSKKTVLYGIKQRAELDAEIQVDADIVTGSYFESNSAARDKI